VVEVQHHQELLQVVVEEEVLVFLEDWAVLLHQLEHRIAVHRDLLEQQAQKLVGE
jgi:hypothetical protein